ncbi:MAG: LacI family DNA-binding transcriptional regulator [Acetobacteraceae bacterium]
MPRKIEGGGPGPAIAPHARKARLDQIAALAGVGIATVDRVLNERGNVSPETTRKVIEAARKLKWPRTLPLPYRRGLRLDILLSRPDTPFFQRLSRAFANAANTLDRSVIVQRTFVDETIDALAGRIRSTQGQAVALYGEEDAAVIDAITALTVRGIPVVTLVSDIPTSPRLAYVGIDHYSAGRTAAFFMEAMARPPGPLLVLCHSLRYRAHAERVSGFRDRIHDGSSGFTVASVLEGHDDQSVSSQLLSEALGRIRGVVGVYNTGGANAAVEAALKSGDLAGKAVFIGHELSSETRRMLEDGTMTLTIDQNPELQARRAINILLHRFGYLEESAGSSAVPFVIYGPENLKPAIPG